MPTNKPPAKGRRNVPLFIILPPEERARLIAFAKSIDRPFSWAVRDALRVYLDAVEGDAAKLASLRANISAPALDLSNAARTVQSKRGPKKKD